MTCFTVFGLLLVKLMHSLGTTCSGCTLLGCTAVISLKSNGVCFGVRRTLHQVVKLLAGVYDRQLAVDHGFDRTGISVALCARCI